MHQFSLAPLQEHVRKRRGHDGNPTQNWGIVHGRVRTHLLAAGNELVTDFSGVAGNVQNG